VLGRRLEEVMFAALVRYASENHYTHIAGEYSPTAKNSQVADLYHRLGCVGFRWDTSRVFAAPAMIECTDLTQRAGAAV
jgi:predicted enzyme involved in methoxymalonyl-ACP biosynthesis